MSIEAFRQHALANDLPSRELTAAEIESKFWRGVAGGPPALYGADSSEVGSRRLPCVAHDHSLQPARTAALQVGSLFPPELQQWNLAALPGGIDNDLLQALPDPIPGLNQSMLYFVRALWRSNPRAPAAKEIRRPRA